MTDYPDEQSRKLGEWLEAVDNIKEGDEQTLPRLLSNADTSTLMDAFGAYMDILRDHKEGYIAWDEWDNKVVAALREELRIRGLEYAPGEGWDETTADPIWGPRTRQ
jgi:hypothetical protein